MTDTPALPPPMVVTVGEGVVRMGGLRDSPSLLLSTLEMPGGSLTFDVRDLDAAAVVHDVREAAAWVRAVFGDRVSALAAVLDPLDPHVLDADASSRLLVASTDARADLSRLALGQWIRRYWPRAGDVPLLDEALLEIELAAIAWRYDELLPGIQANEAFLRGSLGTLRDAVARAIDSPPDAGTRAILSRASEAALYGDMPEETDASLLDDLESLLPALVASKAPPGGGFVAWLDDHRVRRNAVLRRAIRADFGLAAGERTPSVDSGGIYGVDSVSWSLVPPRVLDWSENTAHWDAMPTDAGWRVSVDVEAAPAPDRGADLCARLYRPGDSLPITICRLQRAGERYRGEAVIDGDPDGLLVDVFDRAFVRPPVLDGAGRERDAAAREAARHFIHTRAIGAYGMDGADRPFLGESLGA